MGVDSVVQTVSISTNVLFFSMVYLALRADLRMPGSRNELGYETNFPTTPNICSEIGPLFRTLKRRFYALVGAAASAAALPPLWRKLAE
jgi:hypothetical protein